jgi:amino acid transporter
MFFPLYYISELILSFLPYMLVIGFIGFIISMVLLRNKKLAKYIQIMPLFVLLFGLLFFLTSRQYNHFYTGE